MRYVGNRAEDVKIAYIGGGSRGWAWGLMSDLAAVEDMSGSVALYDIDRQAAEKNAVIGNRMQELDACRSVWRYAAADSLKEALTGADFVVISIMPGTFDEMESDVHAPEKYGIYQSVGDTAGPGGLMRGLRTIPMFEEIGAAVRDFCPSAWVINYTNPMTVCVRTLYRVFPQIKAFGCCHEVFGTQKLLARMLDNMEGIQDVERDEIHVNVVGVNHFTWLTQAQYRNQDLFPLYRKFADKYWEEGFGEKADENWMNRYFDSRERVKLDLFRRFGVIAAAGDRHLAEFCPGAWYLKDPDTVHAWRFNLTPVSWRKQDLQNRLARSERLYTGEEAPEIHQTGEEGVQQMRAWRFNLTPVSWRKQDLQNRLARSERLYTGEEAPEIHQTGEEGVQQMRALLGLRDLVTNVNIPNRGQIPNLPMDAVVETNAHFCADCVRPVFAGAVPDSVIPMVGKVCGIQEMVVEAALTRNLELAFQAFLMDPNMNLGMTEAKELFDTMIGNTKGYLGMYF